MISVSHQLVLSAGRSLNLMVLVEVPFPSESFAVKHFGFPYRTENRSECLIRTVINRKIIQISPIIAIAKSHISNGCESNDRRNGECRKRALYMMYGPGRI